jgi:tetratricopeptide (TPR) repeat protein
VAITLDRLGRYEEAIAAYRRALAVQPDDAATHFHLGTTCYKSGATDLAEASFRRALALAPDSLYDHFSRRYLDALAQQRAQAQRPGAPNLFSLYAEAGVQYDSNIPAAPDDPSLYQGKHGGVRVVEYVSAELRFLRRPGWLGSLEASTYQAQYPDSAFEAFDLSTYGAGLLLQRDTTLGSLPVTALAKYGYSWVYLDGDPYSGSHQATVSFQLDEARWTATNVYYRYTRDDFEDEGFDPAISSRDADNHAVGITQILYFADRRGQVRLGYEYQDNRADGLNFDFQGHRVSVGATVPLPWEAQGELNAEYAHEEYPDFQGPVRRKTDRWTVGGNLSRWLFPKILLRLTGQWTSETSSYRALEYDRWVVGLSLSYAH